MAAPNDIVQFGDESPEPEEVKLITKEVSEQDIFKLAKSILVVCAIVYMIIAMLKVFLCSGKGIDEVWEYSKVFLNSIISLVLGLYFGQKKKSS